MVDVKITAHSLDHRLMAPPGLGGVCWHLVRCGWGRDTTVERKNMKNMRRSLIALAASGMLAAPLMAQAAGDPSVGKEKYATCAACHGADGQGHGGAFPKMIGLGEEETVKKMTAYRDGDQEYLKSVGLGDRYGTMAPNASNLSDEDIANLAAYIAQEFGGAAA
ncbi:MAG TPA: cytochrome c, partial [Guyparkeria sp.]|nr:cytochrome c [Guyparkeria sp.]